MIGLRTATAAYPLNLNAKNPSQTKVKAEAMKTHTLQPIAVELKEFSVQGLSIG